MSYRNFLVSSFKDKRLCPHYRLQEVRILDGGADYEVNRPSKQLLQIFQQSEVGVRVSLVCFWLELYEEIQITDVM